MFYLTGKPWYEASYAESEVTSTAKAILLCEENSYESLYLQPSLVPRPQNIAVAWERDYLTSEPTYLVHGSAFADGHPDPVGIEATPSHIDQNKQRVEHEEAWRREGGREGGREVDSY